MINQLLGELFWSELENHLSEFFRLANMEYFYGFKNHAPERNAELIFFMLIKVQKNKIINPEERYLNFNYRKLDVGEQIYTKEELLQILQNILPVLKRTMLNNLFGDEIFFENMIIVPKYSEQRFNEFSSKYSQIENLNELFLEIGSK